MSKARTLIIACTATIILIVSRMFVLLYGTDHSTGLFSPEGDIYNIVFYILLALSAAAIIASSVADNRGLGKKCEVEIKNSKLTVIGATMIAVGAVEALAVMNEFAKGLNVFSVFIIAGCIAFVAGGIMIASGKELKPVYSVPALVVLISYLAQAIRFFLENPLISKIPQKLMMMAFLVSAAYFWLFFGRIISGDKRTSTKLLAVATGYFSSVCTVSFIASTYILLVIDSEKWMRLTCIPGIVLIPAAIAPAIIATIITSSVQKASNPTEVEETTSENAQQEETEETAFVNKSRDE